MLARLLVIFPQRATAVLNGYFCSLLQRKATVGMILRLVSSAEDPLYRSMVIDFSGRKHDAKTLLKQIFVYYNLEFLKLEGCELTDRDIFNVREIKCKVKYLCLWDNKFTKPWQLLAIRFPLVEHLNMERNKIPVERIGRSHEGNKLEHCTRIDVDEWDYRREKFFRAYCPSLKYVNGVKLEQLTGTQGAAATSGADDEGCTSMRENQMESGESSDDVDDWERNSDDFFL